MSTTAPQFEAAQTPRTTYRAAVVHDFEGPLTVEEVAPRALEPGQIRVKVEASGLCHTDIHAAHGDWPVKPSPPFVPGHEGVGIVAELGPGVTEVARRRPRRDAVARLRVRHLRLLRLRAGRRSASSRRTWATRSTAASASTPSAYARYVVKVPDGRRSVRRRAAHLRRRHDLQGRQGRGHALVRPRRRLRRRRARPHGDPVRGDRRRAGDRGRPHRREARARPRARRRVHDQRGQGGPGRSDPAARRRRPGDRAGRLAARVRAGLRLASPRRHARLRRAAGRQRGRSCRSSRPC